MCGLAPLCICRLVAVAAVLCRQKALRINELAGVRGGVGRQEWLVRAKAIVVVRSDAPRILRALSSRVVDGIGRPRSPRHQAAGNRAHQQNARNNARSSTREKTGKHRANNSIGFRLSPASALRREKRALHRKVEMAIPPSDEGREPWCYFPVPSVIVTIRSTPETVKCSTLPLGQCTSMSSTLVACPSPK